MDFMTLFGEIRDVRTEEHAKALRKTGIST
jgi:hypothetical protein